MTNQSSIKRKVLGKESNEDQESDPLAYTTSHMPNMSIQFEREESIGHKGESFS
jgi:hypothetical protein